ncbi:MAG: hypothetical protein H7245_22595, partial [Candidatus Saccharibacteria bacterium]|nr:hypothetical protein [Pseudorhodobacter sp.]
MKPSFALDFRDGVISLLHRTTRGWQQVGASPLDAPDLGDALTYLRSTALGLSPRGLTTKLVIPNEMILYTQVHAPGPDISKRRKQIRLALEGLTPYKVEDLVFDWWGNGTEVEVAVVARATLAEAEAFAVEHRFNPVSFVGAPETGNFMGEPFFGPSALSATLLTEGEKVDRDQDPVSVMVREYGKTAAPTVPVTARVADAVVPPVVTDPVAAPAMPAAEAPMAPIVKAKVETPAAESVVIPTPEAAKVATPVKAQDPLPDFRAAKAPAQGVAGFDPAKMALDLVDEAPMAVDVSDDSPPPPFNPAPLPPVMAPAAKTQPVAAPPVPTPPVPTLPVPAPPMATPPAGATSGTASQTTAKSVEAETDSDV